MGVKILLVLLLCALQQVHGSKSKKKGESRLKNFFKNCLIALAVNYGANEVVQAGKPQLVDSNFLACKFTVPDQNAGVMMNFVKCANDQDFEKYVFGNSKNCPKINELYKETKINENCGLNTPKIIPNRALARFRGEKLSHATNVKMLKEYLFSSTGKDGAIFESEEFVSKFLRGWVPSQNFDFFRFTNIFELTKLAFPDDTSLAVSMALKDYKDVNGDNAKKLFELTKLVYPDHTKMAVSMALRDEYKDVDGDNAKKLFELLKLAYPDHTGLVVQMALDSKFKVDADNAKKMFELTNLVYPDHTKVAVRMALLDYKDVNADNAKNFFELTKFVYQKSWEALEVAVRMASLDYKDVNTDNAKKLFELTKVAFPGINASTAALWAFSDYKHVNVDQVRRVLELTKILNPKNSMEEALKPKYRDIDVDKVNEKYQDLKNSGLRFGRSEQSIMKEVLRITYPDVVKENF